MGSWRAAAVAMLVVVATVASCGDTATVSVTDSTTTVAVQAAVTVTRPTVVPTPTPTPTPAPTPAPTPTPTPTPAPTPAPAPAPTADRSLDATEVLAGLTVAPERPDGYERALFPHWLASGQGSCNVREAVLIRDSRSPAQVDPFGCRVVAGDWLSAYDGRSESEPSALDIDHVVALKEAWDSGAWEWSAARRTAYANDLSDRRTLLAVSATSNRAKGDKDPANWMPPQRNDWCRYLGDWVAVKARWGLTVDASEAGRLRNLLRDNCVGLRIAPWSPAPSR